MTESKLSLTLKNKHVALVGLSSHLEGRCLGKLIDAADVVVRVNASVIDKQLVLDLGGRTDILFTSYNKDIRKNLFDVTNSGPSEVVLAYPDIIPFSKNNADFYEDYGSRLAIKKTSEQDYQYLCSVLGCRPSSGLMAVKYLLGKDLLSLTVYGFSFFSLSHYRGLRKWRSNRDLLDAMVVFNTHQPKKEFEFFKELYALDCRLNVDPFMQELLRSGIDIPFINIRFKWLVKLYIFFRELFSKYKL